jgi:hypothetical protein
MRRYIAAVAVGAALALAGCGSDTPEGGDTSPGGEVSAEANACARFTELSNEWAPQYGSEIAAALSAEAAGDEDRKDTAVLIVKQLYADWAGGLRTEAGAVSEAELSGALNRMADGIDEIADGIETFEDVQASPQLLEEGAVAEAGTEIAQLCAG